MVRLIDIIRGGAEESRVKPGGKGNISFKKILSNALELQKNPPPSALIEGKVTEATAPYENLCGFFRFVTNAVKKREKFAIEPGVKLINDLAENPASLEPLYNQALKPRDFTDFWVYHTVNVCIFALMIGRRLEYSKQKLLELGLAAFFQDIGLALIPLEILGRNDHLNPEEIQTIKKHPQYSYEVLLSLDGDYKWIADLVLQTHERENGQGYPNGLKGDQIHEYAKIIGVADIFEALTHQRPHRKRRFPYDAVKELINSYKDLFPIHILRALILEFSVFPIWSYVKLNSGAIGRVIATSENHPLRPVIKMVYDSEGKRSEEDKIIKLTETPLLHITASADEKSLNKMDEAHNLQKAQDVLYNT